MPETSSTKVTTDALGKIQALMLQTVELQQARARLEEQIHELEIKRTDLTGGLLNKANESNELAEKRTDMAQKRTSLTRQQTRLSTRSTEMANIRTEMGRERTSLAGQRTDLTVVRTDMARSRSGLAGQRTDLAGVRTRLAHDRTGLAGQRTDLRAKKRASRSEADVIDPPLLPPPLRGLPWHLQPNPGDHHPPGPLVMRMNQSTTSQPCRQLSSSSSHPRSWGALD